MKTIFLISTTLCLLLASTFAGIPAPAQDAAAPNPYQRCTTSIKNAPQDAYEPCRQYLEQVPQDDPNHIECVKKWIADYEKALPYVQFLQGLTTNEKGPWLIYKPDMTIQLPPTSEKEGPYKIEISRSFANSNQEAMLRKAEAVYSSPSDMVAHVFRSLDDWEPDGQGNERTREMAPLWGMRGNDEIQSTQIVTARAVRYYYDLTLAVRQNPHLPSGFEALNTDLKYTASIKHVDHYSHKHDHNEDNFDNVYVADLTLKWGFGCGGLCGMGFTRNKVVVLNDKGEVIAMYLDAPENYSSWVS
jgi:hypothetical protein